MHTHTAEQSCPEGYSARVLPHTTPTRTRVHTPSRYPLTCARAHTHGPQTQRLCTHAYPGEHTQTRPSVEPSCPHTPGLKKPAPCGLHAGSHVISGNRLGRWHHADKQTTCVRLRVTRVTVSAHVCSLLGCLSSESPSPGQVMGPKGCAQGPSLRLQGEGTPSAKEPAGP